MARSLPSLTFVARSLPSPTFAARSLPEGRGSEGTLQRDEGGGTEGVNQEVLVLVFKDCSKEN